MLSQTVIELLLVAVSMIGATYILDLILCGGNFTSMCWIEHLVSKFSGGSDTPSKGEIAAGVIVGILLAGLFAAMIHATLVTVVLRKPFSMTGILGAVVSYGAAVGVAYYLVPYIVGKAEKSSDKVSPSGGSAGEPESLDWINLIAGTAVGVAVYYGMSRLTRGMY